MPNVKEAVLQNTVGGSHPCLGCSGCSAGTVEHSVNIKIIPGINQLHQHGIAFDQADLLILTKVLGADLGAGPMAFDAAHGGVISRAVAAQKFKGQVGEHLKIQLPAADGLTVRHIAVVGLGRAEDLGKRGLCNLFNYALTLACRYQANSILIPIFPHRTSAASMNLRASGAILRCLVDERGRRGTLGVLKEVQVLCAPQARRHLERGVAVDHTLCNQCRVPDLV